MSKKGIEILVWSLEGDDVAVRILYQRKRGFNNFRASNGWMVRSADSPQVDLENKTFNVQGRNRNLDYEYMITTSKTLDEITVAIDEFNAPNPQPEEYWANGYGAVCLLKENVNDDYPLRGGNESFTKHGRIHITRTSKGDLDFRVKVTPWEDEDDD